MTINIPANTAQGQLELSSPVETFAQTELPGDTVIGGQKLNFYPLLRSGYKITSGSQLLTWFINSAH